MRPGYYQDVASETTSRLDLAAVILAGLILIGVAVELFKRYRR